MSLKQFKYDSKIAPLYLVASEKGLQGVHFRKHPLPLLTSLKGLEPEIKILAQAVRELSEYFSGKRKTFDLPLDVEGTSFQKSVWNELSKIPYGKTYSYQDVAMRIRNAKACRAVGTANGRNPLSIIVPCHRVIAADGTLGGYGGGLDIKMKLLELEQESL
jgi:methylated-DNA-[protein]-cysteine S-methyltransferase